MKKMKIKKPKDTMQNFFKQINFTLKYQHLKKERKYNVAMEEDDLKTRNQGTKVGRDDIFDKILVKEDHRVAQKKTQH